MVPASAGPTTKAAWRETPTSAFAEPRLLDEQRQDPAEGRLEEPAAETVQRDERDEDAEVEMPGRVHDCKGGDDDGASGVGADEQQLARVAIREHAADEQRRDEAERLDHEDDP